MELKKKIIIYGASGGFDKWYHALKACYTIVGVSDSDTNKKEKVESLGERFIHPKEISAYDFDIIYIISVHYVEIYSSLVYDFNIKRSKILEISDFVNRENELCLGDLNPDRTIYIYRYFADKCGLFVSVNSFLRAMDLLGGKYEVFVDFQNYENIYLENSKLGRENSWEYFFKQPFSEKIENVYKSKNVILGHGKALSNNVTVKNRIRKERFFKEYQDKEHSFSNIQSEMFEAYVKSLKNLYKKYIVLSDDMQEIIDAEYRRIFLPIMNKGKKICGVFCRGSDYTKLKTYKHSVQPTIEQVIDKTRQMMSEWGFDYVYFDSEDEIAFETFCSAFPNEVVYSERARIREYQSDELINVKFERENDEYLKGMEYVRSCYLMARCNFLIGGLFGGTISTNLITEGFEDSFLFYLGYYGLHDDSYFMTPNGRPIYIKRENANDL